MFLKPYNFITKSDDGPNVCSSSQEQQATCERDTRNDSASTKVLHISSAIRKAILNNLYSLSNATGELHNKAICMIYSLLYITYIIRHLAHSITILCSNKLLHDYIHEFAWNNYYFDYLFINDLRSKFFAGHYFNFFF